MKIPKIIHIIWVGDESIRPDNCIATWRELNPTWDVRIWGNQELAEFGWVNSAHMTEMYGSELNGVADLMRWEILYHIGGLVVDADSICVRPLDDWMLECESFACWENEIVRPNLVAAGYVASVPQNSFYGQLVLDLKNKPTVLNGKAWETVGPLFLTTAYRQYQYVNLTVFPSHFFIPRHYTGVEYTGSGPIYAKQAWASTKVSYDSLHQMDDFSGL
jgi:mannosyltransferase OCH1-like enzyme